ncbi:hypothetical protein PR048_027230 [Dryococelus australis]|uniref:Integrator complex subunit 5 N-terminal domain-containing protein n=1 Tax=Dryococelus australis TaxID=614101 RepID=A0ABQ9GGC3_9NEOP|nr:hypothetical protein PR048_027230 [Dryococelus australis]
MQLPADIQSVVAAGTMASTSVIKGGGQQDLLGELRTFVAGATRTVKTNPVEFARTALSLLKTLPAARDAVLEYFCSVFDIAVDKYITEVKVRSTLCRAMVNQVGLLAGPRPG